ncbi:MAG: metal ABC transporter permease [Planctomycetota bacterium]
MLDLLETLNDPTFRTVFMGTAAIGAVSGALGCFAYLRKQSLIGDVISHSSLFGVMLFFIISYLVTGQGSKSLFLLIPGAIFAGFLSLWLTNWLVHNTRVREDSGLGVMLAIFFGSGIFMLRWVQSAKPVIPGRRGLEDYIFGMAAAMTRSDLIMIAIVGAGSILMMLLFWKQLKAYTFDPIFCQSLGYRFRWLDALLIVLLVNGIVIGIQCIGVVLMIAMMVTPGASARQWTRSLGGMVLLASIFGAMSGAAGSLASSLWSDVPTGPSIVLAGIAIFVVSVLFAPERGVITGGINREGNIEEQTA